MTTHYLEEADQLCDRIAVIDHGKIIAIGTPRELKESIGGDVLEIRVTQDSSDFSDPLKALPGVKTVSRAKEVYRVKCSDGETLVPQAITAASKVGVSVTGVAVIKPTLDEVFLQLTGRSYRGEGEAEAADSSEATGSTPAPGGD